MKHSDFCSPGLGLYCSRECAQEHSGPADVLDDVLAVNHLMREPVTQDEAERVLHALLLANYVPVRRAQARTE